MGWLLGCLKGSNRPKRRRASYSNQAKPKNQTAVAGNALPVRASSAVVAHATIPEDLYKVRISPTESPAVVRCSYDKGDPFESCPPSLHSQAQSKKSEAGKCSPGRNDANKVDHSGGEWSHVDEELESLRRKLMQEADAAKKLSDEVKYLRACRELLESPPKAFKVGFDKLDKDSTGQVDCGQRSWLLSSVLKRIQPEGCSLENRGIRASRSGDFQDGPGNSNVLKCAELNLFRVESGVYDELIHGINESNKPTQCAEDCISRAPLIGHTVQSPPWTFSEAKHDIANHKNSHIFETSEDLLLEHLDLSSLIKDSELITNWENSFGELETEERLSRDQSLIEETAQSWQVPGEEEVGGEDGLDAKSCKRHSENWTDGSPFDCGSCCSMVLSEDPAVEESSLATGFQVVDGQIIYAPEVTNMDSELEFHTEIPFSQAGFCTCTEESSNAITSQSCFSPQFRLSKQLWSSKRKSAPEREARIFLVADNSRRNNSDVHEVRLPCTHPAMQDWQQVESSEDGNHPFLDALSHPSTECSEKQNDSSSNSSESAGVQLDHMNHSSDTSSSKKSAQQGFSQVSPVEDETAARRNDNLNLASLIPTEEENGAQRKKLRHEVNSSSERVLVEEQQARVLDSAFGNGHKNGSAAGSSISNEALNSKFVETTMFNWLSNEGTFKQDPASSTATSPSSQIQTPPKFMGSHPSPARLADDRPILGTVAAHWSPISTRKWWDGKGIPNSTNKYKEDQKVSWHAIPFEVRLEQALAKQDCVRPK